MRAAKVQASLRIRAVLPKSPLLAHTSSESRGPFRQKARSLALLNGWACAVKICHDGMLKDTNSLDASEMPSVCRVLLCREDDYRIWNQGLLQTTPVTPQTEMDPWWNHIVGPTDHYSTDEDQFMLGVGEKRKSGRKEI